MRAQIAVEAMLNAALDVPFGLDSHSAAVGSNQRIGRTSKFPEVISGYFDRGAESESAVSRAPPAHCY